MSELIDQESKHRPVSSEQLNQWIERGLTAGSVATFGTSIENFRNLINTGLIPSTRISLDLDYQPKIVGAGKLIYYTSSIFSGIQPVKPALARAIVRGYGLNPDNPDDVNWVKNQGFSARRSARSYATQNAFRDYFFNKTGLFEKAKDILGLAAELIPWDVDDYIDSIEGASSDYDDIKDASQERMSFMKVLLGRDQLEGVLSEMLKRRGVVIYYNKELLDYPLKLGREAESELLITPKDPIGVHVIDGIELFSNEEKEEIGI